VAVSGDEVGGQPYTSKHAHSGSEVCRRDCPAYEEMIMAKTTARLSTTQAQNARSEWVPAIPEPYFLAFGRVRCDCGDKVPRAASLPRALRAGSHPRPRRRFVMLQVLTTVNNRTTLLLGLDRENTARLHDGQPIVVDAQALLAQVDSDRVQDVAIFAGETLADLHRDLSEYLPLPPPLAADPDG
jgi:hypothetical protein